MKRILSVFLAVLLVAGMVPSIVMAADEVQFAGGDGTAENPYQIATAEQLDKIRNDLTANYELIADINLEGVARWEKIGNKDNPFSGSLNGNNYTISNLKIVDEYGKSMSSNYVGLFSYIDSATIQNITFSDVDIEVYAGYVGCISGYATNSIIVNCNIEGILYGIGDYGNNVGGVVGTNSRGEIRNCNFSGLVEGTSAGGITSTNSGLSIIECCTVTAHSGRSYISAYFPGGIVGYNDYSGTIRYCYNANEIWGNKYYSGGGAGGIVGNNKGAIESCFNTGYIHFATVYGGSVGGISGANSGNILNCYNTGLITSDSNKVCGIATGGTIENCYNVGRLDGTTNYGISVNENVQSCYYITSNNVQDSGGGTMKSAAELQQKATFEGYDFKNIWMFTTGYPYPQLSNNRHVDVGAERSINDAYGIVNYLSKWDESSKKVCFGDTEVVSPYTYTLSDSVDTSNINDLLNKYVLVTAEQGESVLEYTITDIQPVESAIGTVTATNEHSMTVDGTEYPVREDYIVGLYQGQEILYHTSNGTIMSFDVLEEKSGTMEGWNSPTGRVTIDGTEYPTNFLTDMSFLGHVEEYLGEDVTYFVSGDDSYKPLIRIDGVVEVESEIAVFSTEKSLTVKTGDSMWLGFGKIADGEIIGDWKRMAIVVSDPTVISLSEYEETEYGYSLEVTGKKQGSTNVTITDTESGAHTVIVIAVRDSYVGTYSYAIDNMETFYPNNEWEDSVQTNIYNLNGLYVNNYQESKTGAAYTVSFDVYNSQYHTGAVDIYDADGNWIDCEEIKKFSMISSLWDTGEQAYYLISDAVNGKLLTYEQASFAEHTSISIEVPDGGYFAISNNFAESPGAFLFNSCEILYDGTCTLIDAALDVKNDKVALSAFSDLVKSEITNDKTVREQFIDIFKKTAKKEAQKCLKKFAISEIDDRYADISGLFENLLNSLDISWKHLFKSATGVGESAFTKFAGPAGVALKGCFAFTKGGNQLVQAVHLAASVDAPYATVFSSIDEGSINPHGVIVNTNGNIDAEAELHVFRVSNDDTIEVVLNESGDDHLKKYELYNICFVKNDQLVQPSGMVTVRIPIPDGMKGDTCCVCRQESDGTWTILTAHIEGNYLVFETDHFSLYGIVGDADELNVSSLPTKTVYNAGDILDPDGLVLSLGDMLITDGSICEPTVLAQAGTQKVTVRYGVASTEFSVSVQAKADDGSSGGGSTGGSSTGSSSTGGGSMGGGSTGGASSGGSSAGGAGGSGGSGSSGGSGGSGSFGTPKVSFTDVASDAWYYAAVQYVAEHSLMAGYGNNRFGPEENVTRGQFAQILYNKEGKSAVTPISGFTDVPSGAWYYDAVTWAGSNGVVNGYGNGKFGPEDEVTREQLAVMLYRYAGEPWAAGTLSDFADADEASGYAVDALRWAVAKGILTGKGSGVLDPKGSATRAEAAAILMRYLENT